MLVEYHAWRAIEHPNEQEVVDDTFEEGVRELLGTDEGWEEVK